MRFQTPQFIDIEDKIFGPLTLKQFIYLVGGGGLSFLMYMYLPLIFAIPLIGVVAALAFSLAFYQVNNKPFIYVLQSALYYVINSRLYLWKKRAKKITKKEAVLRQPQEMPIPTVREGKLGEIAWNLSVQDESNVEENKDVTLGE